MIVTNRQQHEIIRSFRFILILEINLIKNVNDMTLSIQLFNTWMIYSIPIMFILNIWFTEYIPLLNFNSTKMVLIQKQHSKALTNLFIMIQFLRKYMIDGMVVLF